MVINDFGRVSWTLILVLSVGGKSAWGTLQLEQQPAPQAASSAGSEPAVAARAPAIIHLIHQNKSLHDDISAHIDLIKKLPLTLVSDSQKAQAATENSSQLMEKLKNRGFHTTKIEGSTGGKRTETKDIAGVLGYHPQSDTAIVSFHGAVRTEDWISSLNMLPRRIEKTDSSSGRAHAGFLRDTRRLWPSLTGEVDKLLESRKASAIHSGNSEPKPLNLIITGHSKGGAIGNLVAPLLKRRYGDQIQVNAMLYASPKAFSKKGAKWANEILSSQNESILNIRNRKDAVPKLPLGSALPGAEFKESGNAVKERMGLSNSEAVHYALGRPMSEQTPPAIDLINHFHKRQDRPRANSSRAREKLGRILNFRF